MVSYTRARAEALGIECKVGVATRPVRVVILSAGLLFARAPALGDFELLEPGHLRDGGAAPVSRCCSGYSMSVRFALRHAGVTAKPPRMSEFITGRTAQAAWAVSFLSRRTSLSD